MKIEFELRAEDGREARRAYYQRLRRGLERYFLPFLGVLFMAMPVLATLKGLATGRGLHHLSRSDLLTFGEGGVLLVLGWIVARRGPIAALRPPGRSGPQMLNVDEGGIAISSAGRFAESSLPWTDFSRFVETENLFVLLSLWPTNTSSLYAYRVRSAPDCLYVIPKRAFAPGGMNEFRALLTQHVPGVPARRAAAALLH